MSRMIALAALLLAAASGAMAQDADDDGQQKVVYHINYGGGADDAAYRAAMRNVQNHINAVGAENLDVKVVLHGDGLGLLMQAAENERLQSQIASLKGQNVGFQVCDNTLKGRQISYENDLYDVWEEDIVPSGVAELSRLQQMGYTYIKP
jgi:intracellular sulfur oxidation DsrE/DsrF family protein